MALFSSYLLILMRDDVGDDYLVDHSIYFYLMDPEGQFQGAFGKATTAEEVKRQYDDAVKEWRDDHPGWKPTKAIGRG